MNAIIIRPKIRIVEFPKRQFDSLNKKIVEGIIDAALEAFGPGMTTEEVLSHVYPTDRLYIASGRGRILGFATAILKEQSVYLAGAAITEEAQGKGLYSDFCMRRINFGLENEKEEIGLTTQNPKVELGVTLALEELAGMGVIKTYKIMRQMKRGAYGRQLTKEKPYSGVEEIDKEFTKLDYKAGDAYKLSARLGW